MVGKRVQFDDVALAAVAAFLLETFFGDLPVLVLTSQLLAAFGAAGFALSIKRPW